MPNQVTGVVTTRVDLVGRPATRDPRDKDAPARFLLYKAEGGFAAFMHTHAVAGGGAHEHAHPPTDAETHAHTPDHAANKSGKELLPFPNAKLQKSDPSATTPQGDPAMPETAPVETPPVATPPVVEPAPVAINKAELSDAVRAHIERLEKSQQDSSAAVIAAQAAADRAETLAKSERDARLSVQYRTEAATFTHLPVPTSLRKAEDGTEPNRDDVLGSALRQMDELAPEAAAIIRPMLATSNEALAKSALFGERGSAASTPTTGANDALVSGKVTELRKAEPSLTDAQAFDKVMQANPDLFESVMNADQARRRPR